MEITTGFLKPVAYDGLTARSAGAFVHTQNSPAGKQQSFTTEDIIWALGIWSVIICLSPVIVFYMLMVA